MIARIILNDSKSDVDTVIRTIEVSGYKVLHNTERSISLSPKKNVALQQFKEDIRDLVAFLRRELKIESLTGYVPKSPTHF